MAGRESTSTWFLGTLSRRLRDCVFLGSVTLAATAHGTVFWVAPQPVGDDANPGTRDHPWATAAKAVASTSPGDTVYFREGLYPLSARIEPPVSGTPDAWITFAGYPGEHPVFDGTGYTPTRRETNMGLFNLAAASYLRLRDLHVRNSHGMGFTVRGPSGHVEIIECSSQETFGPGIGLWNCEHIKVLLCEVTRSNTNRMRLYGDSKREAAHEAISSGGAKHFEIAYNHVHHGDKEGIDIKEVSAHGVVHHNYVHDMPRQGLYADAWFGVLEDVEFHHNVVHNCEWGIALSTEGVDSELRDVRIHHNLVHHNRGSGIFFARWNADGPRRHVVVAHNTFYANGGPDQFSGPTGNIDLRSSNLHDIAVFNNLCAAGGTFEIATFAEPTPEGLEQLAAQEIRITHNFIGAFRPIDPAIAAHVVDGSPQHVRYGRAHAVPGEAPILGNAGLLAPERGSFCLAADSAARGAGLIDPTFHGGAIKGAPDVGALAYGDDVLPDPPPVVEHVIDDAWRVVQATVPGRVYRRQESHDNGRTWISASEDAVGQGIPDIHTFRMIDGATPQFRYQVSNPAAAIAPKPEPTSSAPCPLQTAS